MKPENGWNLRHKNRDERRVHFRDKRDLSSKLDGIKKRYQGGGQIARREKHKRTVDSLQREKDDAVKILTEGMDSDKPVAAMRAASRRLQGLTLAEAEDPYGEGESRWRCGVLR